MLGRFFISWISVYSQRMRSGHSSTVEANVRGESRRAMTAIGVFLFFGTIMAFLAGTTLIWQGTFSIKCGRRLRAPTSNSHLLEEQWVFFFWCLAGLWQL